MLFRQCSFDKAEAAIAKVRKVFEKEGYLCAIGLSKWESGEEFQAVYNRVDTQMYEDKSRLKADNHA